MSKTMVSSRMGDKTVAKIEKYAEEKDISRSQALEELARKALTVEDGDGIVLSTDGGADIEKKVSQTTQQTNQIQSQIKSSSTNQQLQILALGLAVLWVMAYYETMIGTGLTIVSGAGVIVANLVPLIREWSK